jgi:hypothetical protein
MVAPNASAVVTITCLLVPMLESRVVIVDAAYISRVGFTNHTPTSPAILIASPKIPAIITNTPSKRRKKLMAPPEWFF